jgi:hypothetical protein
MKGFAYFMVPVVVFTGVVVYIAQASGRSDAAADPVFGIKIPADTALEADLRGPRRR